MTGTARPTRLPAAERRTEIVAAATSCFAERGFAGTTTASVAAAAGVNEALVFRHFGSKQGLYLACVDGAWEQLRRRCVELAAAEEAARQWRMPGRAFLEIVRSDADVARLWMRALVETTGVPQIDEHLAGLMDAVHAFVTEQVRVSVDAGGLITGRDAETEAWTIVALGLLGASLGTRGLIERAAFDDVLAAHREWMTGSSD